MLLNIALSFEKYPRYNIVFKLENQKIKRVKAHLSKLIEKCFFINFVLSISIKNESNIFYLYK